MEWWWLLLADGCPDAGEPLPHCLGDWTGEHDMAEAGELTQTSMVRAGMRLWSTSADVPAEGPNKEPALTKIGIDGHVSFFPKKKKKKGH